MFLKVKYMQKPEINNNFYGIESFRSNPLSNEIKSEMCKYIYVSPKVLAEDARVFANTYITEEHARKLIARLKDQASKINKGGHQIKALKPTAMMDWIEINGFLSISEINEFCEYCELDINEYFEQLENIKIFLVTKSGKLYFEYLRQYQDILNMKQINWALDSYLEHQERIKNKVYEPIITG